MSHIYSDLVELKISDFSQNSTLVEKNRKHSCFSSLRLANLGVPVSLSKPQRVYESYIFGFHAQVTLVLTFNVRLTNATNAPSPLLFHQLPIYSHIS